MDTFDAYLSLGVVLVYAVTITCILISSVSEKNKLKKQLKKQDQIITQLRSELKRTASSPVPAPAPVPAQLSVPVQSEAQPQVSAPAAAPAAPSQQVNTQKPAAVTYTYMPPSNKPRQANAQAVWQPGQQVPVAKPKKEKTKISSINISFAVGVMLITIVGAVFLSASWGFMGNGLRAAVILGAVALVFFLSWLSGHVLKLEQTGFAFYTLGSLLVPVSICGIGLMQLFGKAFSFENGNGYVVAACAAAAFSVVSLIGAKIYPGGAYHGITYFGFTWTVVFTAAQLGEGYDKFTATAAALGIMSAVCMAIYLTDYGKKLKFFGIYSELITYIAAFVSLISLIETRVSSLVAVFFSMAALAIIARFKRNFIKYILECYSFFAIFRCADHFSDRVSFGAVDPSKEFMTDYLFNHHLGVEKLLAVMILMIVLYVVWHLIKTATPICEIGYPALLFGMTWEPFYRDVVAFRVFPHSDITLAGFITATAMALFCILNKRSHKVSVIFNSILFSTMLPITIAKIILRFVDISEYAHLWITVAVALGITVASFVLRKKYSGNAAFVTVAISFAFILIGRAWFGILPFNIVTNTAERILFSFISLAAVGALLTHFGYFFKRDDKLNMPATICFAFFANWISVPVFTTLLLIIPYSDDLIGNIGFSIVIGILLAGSALPLLSVISDRLGKYRQPVINILMVSGAVWTCTAWTIDISRIIIMIAAILLIVIMYLHKSTKFAFLPLIVIDGQIWYFIEDMAPENKFTIILICVIAFGLIGRFLHPKKVFDGNVIDYFSFAAIPLVFLTGVSSDLWLLVVCILLDLVIVNLIGRINISSKILLSVAASLLALGILSQGALEYPDVIGTEIRILIVLADIFVIRYVIKAGDPKTMRTIWIIAVAASLAIEGISAAATGELLDLWVTGIVSIGIFIYAFVVKEKTWFVIAIVAIIVIAIYLSATFWASKAWMFYLLFAGVILIGMAALNEYGKRHSSDGNGGNAMKRFFEEWKW